MEEAAKILVLAVIAAVALAYLKHGPAGPKAWWRSKFLGQVKP